MTESFRRILRGRLFTETQLNLIRELIADHPGMNRSALSVAICQSLSWMQPNGRWKDRACRVALLQMHREGLIRLPAPQRPTWPRKEAMLSSGCSPQAEPGEPFLSFGFLVSS